jgi:exoribonuclease II
VDSHQWVEQMMLVYNKAAGALLKQHRVGILRRHSAPDQERWARYQTMGIPERLAFHAAEYCLTEETNTVHYGLDTDAYAHASSPIRRYADLVNQRMIKHILNGSSDTYIIPITMVDLNGRSKAIKRFAYQMEFLDAITSGQTRFAARIIEQKKENTGDDVTIILYVPQWNRMISTQYHCHSHNTVLSRDERTMIDITVGRDVMIECVFQPYLRKWKERIVFHLIEDVSIPIELKQSTGF